MKAWTALLAVVFAAVSASPLWAQATKNLKGQDPPPIVASGWVNSDQPVNLADLKGKKCVLLEFFMVSCPHCGRVPGKEAADGVLTATQLRRLQENYGGDGLLVISVTNDPPDKVKAFLDENQLKTVVALDTNYKTMLTYGVQGVPWSFLVGASGKIVWQGDPRAVDEIQLQSELIDLGKAK